jgi:protein-S-isoprenylcysteine O-methyltransferase Ste14
MDTFLLVILGFIAAMLLFSVPYLIWYGRVKGVAEEPGRRSDLLLSAVWFTALGAALYERLVLRWLPFGGWLPAAGVALVVVGISGRLICRRTLGRNYLPQLRIQAGQRLVTTGPYRYVRHPMYSASLLLDIGLTLALGSVVGTVLMGVGMLAVFVYRIRVEEALLGAQFGDEWRAYVSKTTYRLVPLVF